MERTKLWARQDADAGTYQLFADGMDVPFGTVAEFEGVFAFDSDLDPELVEMVEYYAHYDEATGSLPALLQVVRNCYDALDAQRAAEQEAELASERAQMRALETFDEHRHEMEWQDAAGYT